MDLNSDLVVVSIYGRGHWVAAYYQQLGAKVTVIDLTSQMGSKIEEDWQSPFGFFQDEAWDALWLDRWAADAEVKEIPSGLTVLLPEGPIEVNGPIQSWRKRKSTFKTIKNIQQIYASNHNVYPLEFKADEKFTENKRPLFLREENSKSLRQSQEWLREKNIQVLDDVTLVDIGMADRNNISIIEVKRERTDLLQAKHIMWCLTSEETKFYKSELHKKVYNLKTTEADWSWMSYKIKIEKTVETSALPEYFITVFDKDLNWSYENFLILRRGQEALTYTVWCLCPNSQRFHKNDLQGIGEKIASELNIRLKGAKIQITGLPLESKLTYKERGPSMFPVFTKKTIKKSRFKNLYFNHPEVWDGCHINSRYWSQKKMADQLGLWWKKKVERELKEQRKRAKS